MRHWKTRVVSFDRPDKMDDVLTAYRARANEYVELFGTIDSTSELDRALLLGWAQSLDGTVVDVGCGPGQWTSYLHDAGIEVIGVDPVAEFIGHARFAFPEVDFRLGRADNLGAGDLRGADASFGGILSWYSLIHEDPSTLTQILGEFARCVAPGGGLALGFFTGPGVEPFDHAVTTAYYWPIEILAAFVDEAGFTVTHTETRTDPGARPHGALIASRRPDC